jgi:hypothetical protein
MARPLVGSCQQERPARARYVVTTRGHVQSGTMASLLPAKRRWKPRAFRGEMVTGWWPTRSYTRTQKRRPRRGCLPKESFLWWCVCRWGGRAGGGPKEWSRLMEKWSGRSSLAAQNSLWGQGTTGGGYHRWGAYEGRRRRGISRCPALLAGATGTLSVQEGHGDGALLLVRSDNSEVGHQRKAMAGKVAAGAEQSNEEPQSKGGRGK